MNPNSKGLAEAFSNLEEHEKKLIIRLIPSNLLFDEVQRRCEAMENMLSAIRSTLNGEFTLEEEQ